MVRLKFPRAASCVLCTRFPRGRVILRAVHRDISIPTTIATKPIVSIIHRIWLICFSIGTSDKHTRMVPHRSLIPMGKKGMAMSSPGVLPVSRVISWITGLIEDRAIRLILSSKNLFWRSALPLKPATRPSLL